MSITPFFFFLFELIVKLYAGDIFLKKTNLTIRFLIVYHHSPKNRNGGGGLDAFLMIDDNEL
jgi:hypothetical protein